MARSVDCHLGVKYLKGAGKHSECAVLNPIGKSLVTLAAADDLRRLHIRRELWRQELRWEGK